MKKNIFILSLLLITMIFASCDTNVEAIQLQKPKTYSEEYYQNLRDYKKSDHQLSFGWFSQTAFMHTPGCRYVGLPDSLDICSLWGGIPTGQALDEMRWVQEVKGTRFVYSTFPSIGNTEFINLPEEERIQAYGDHLLKMVYDNNLDGMDLDYEIRGDWMWGNNMVELVKYLGQHIGPLGKDPSKLLIVDGYDINGGYEYVSYFVSQAYYSPGASDLQRRFNSLHSKGLTPEKYIVTETVAETPLGGHLFVEADGNTESVFKGEKLRSIEGMAKWNPTQGKKAGFGGFCIQYDYNNQPGYKYIRMGIQLQNPAKNTAENN